MALSLSNKQAEELHKSIIAYLAANNLPNAAAAVRADLNLGEDVFDAATAKKYENLLERKWTSIVRLQKKVSDCDAISHLPISGHVLGDWTSNRSVQVMDLEARNQAIQSELDNTTPLSLSKRSDPASWLPKAPAQRTLESHQDTINCVAFHPIYSSIASGSDDCTIKIWDFELGELERTIKGHTRAVLDVDFGGPRGSTLLASCSSDLTIKLWDPANEYKNIRTLPGHDHSVSAIRFIPSGVAGAPTSGSQLVSASRDKTLKIWDVATGFCLRTLRGHAEWVRNVSPSMDGRYLVSTGDDMTARLWDISATEPEAKVVMFGHEHFNECCAFAPPSSYQYLAQLAGLKKPPPATSTAEFMATGSRDKTIRIWDARGTCLLTLRGHDNWVRALEFHPSGKYLLSASDDKTVRCWDLSQDGKCIKTIEDVHERFVTCLRWAPGIVNYDDNSAASSGTPQRNGAKPAAPEIRIRCIIATGGVDRKLRIFAN
ncbi:nuclear distribution protein PAC1 [Apiospora kogelbergensis]|uniref:Nuclear distribution protein PAC1 n=1 Tax=Apiospora kogelbergensis TaxID=1337665 RepID=A0AAW0Q8L2_9PEZI